MNKNVSQPHLLNTLQLLQNRRKTGYNGEWTVVAEFNGKVLNFFFKKKKDSYSQYILI